MAMSPDNQGEKTAAALKPWIISSRMINPKKLAQLTRKWKRVKIATKDDETCCIISPVAYKGYFTMYTVDGSRFEVPLLYLSAMVFSELLRMTEFSFTGNGTMAGSLCLVMQLWWSI